MKAETAPEWKDGDRCHSCAVIFTTFLRKCHCRACGQVLCNQCAGKFSVLPKYGIEEEVRVCIPCYDEVNNKPVVTTTPKDDDIPIEELTSSLAHFENLLESGDMSDVTFEIGQENMRLHKAIVTSMSPVFQAMFLHQMKEKKESVVQIPDVKYEVMRELFRYIYVRKVNDIESIADELLVAADKYAIQGLKLMCEKAIHKKMNADNALQYLELATAYNTTFLKPKAVEFVVSRLGEFVDTTEFEQMEASCKDELLRAIARKNLNK